MKPSLILVINCGSSSLKFALYDTSKQSHNLVCEGLAESLNQTVGKLSYKQHTNNTQSSKQVFELKLEGVKPHGLALEKVVSILESDYQVKQYLQGIGHRVVHGGKVFKQSTLINDKVVSQIKSCIPLAPLHNPANVMGIEIMREQFSGVPQVAVFDTSFHQTLPAKAYLYALPYEYYEQHDVRKYGFHGTSHRYISQFTARILQKDTSEINIISAHLGNGASVASISKGKSQDTSMGMTPLEGLVMGTRSGDLDPGIFDYLISLGHSPNEISTILNKKSGLLGVSGSSNDMREICELSEQGHEGATLALELFCFRAAKHIAGMMISLSNLDALVFTGGIGENSALVREKITNHLKIFGLSLSTDENNKRHSSQQKSSGVKISDKTSIPIFVVPTDEEGVIVQDTINLISTAH